MINPWSEEARKRARKNGEKVLKVEPGIKLILKGLKLKRKDMNIILKD